MRTRESWRTTDVWISQLFRGVLHLQVHAHRGTRKSRAAGLNQFTFLEAGWFSVWERISTAGDDWYRAMY